MHNAHKMHLVLRRFCNETLPPETAAGSSEGAAATPHPWVAEVYLYCLLYCCVTPHLLRSLSLAISFVLNMHFLITAGGRVHEGALGRGVQRNVVIAKRIQLPHVSFTCLKTPNIIIMNVNC